MHYTTISYIVPYSREWCALWSALLPPLLRRMHLLLLIQLALLIATILIIDIYLIVSPVSALTVNSKWIKPTRQNTFFITVRSLSKGHDFSKSKSRPLIRLYGSDPASQSPSDPISQSPSDPYLKHSCKSCSYVYDEEKGFKKRYPPGILFGDGKWFLLLSYIQYRRIYLILLIESRLSIVLCFTGTRFRDLKVFMCPVCGAAINQFEQVAE